jgi:hypothetical protein
MRQKQLAGHDQSTQVYNDQLFFQPGAAAENPLKCFDLKTPMR